MATNKTFDVYSSLTTCLLRRVGGSKDITEFQAIGEGYVLVNIGLSLKTVAIDVVIYDFGTDKALVLQVTAESDSIALNIVSQIREVNI